MSTTIEDYKEYIKPNVFKATCGELKGADDYQSWSKKAKIFFGSIPYALGIIGGTIVREGTSVGPTTAEWDMIEGQIRAALAAGISGDILLTLDDNANSYEIWKVLSDTYGSHTLGDWLSIMNELKALEFDGSVEDLHRSFQIGVRKLAAAGSPLDPNQALSLYMEKIKVRAKSTYDYFCHMKEPPKLQEVMNDVIQAERRGDITAAYSVNAYHSSYRGGMSRSRPRVYRGGPARADSVCYFCGLPGHIQRNCPNKGFYNGGFNAMGLGQANTNRGGFSFNRGMSFGGQGRGGNGYRGGNIRGGHNGYQVNQYDVNNQTGNIEDLQYLDGAMPQPETKSQPTGPVHPQLPQGLDVPKIQSLCPNQGPFGADPNKRGSSKDELTKVHSSLICSALAQPSLQQGPITLSLCSLNPYEQCHIDSGATATVVPSKELVTGFKPQESTVTYADNTLVGRTAGVGTAHFLLHHAGGVTHITLHAVVIPNARAIYISTGDLQERGIETRFPANSKSCILLDSGGNTICEGQRSMGHLYEMPIRAVFNGAKINAIQPEGLQHALGHLRLAHVHDRVLQQLVKDGKIKNFPTSSLHDTMFCAGCRFGKAHNLPYTQPPREKATEFGAKTHFDIFGPVSVAGISGCKWVLFIVDEAYNWVTVYFMKKKSDTPHQIMHYKRFMEAQYPGHFKMRVLRSDNAVEILKSQLMQDWMAAHGLADEESPPYTPQLNGVPERAIRTAWELVRSSLALGKLRPHLWDEILRAVVYVRNRVPSQAIGGRIPYELVHKKNVNLDHLRILGCDAYALHKAPGRSKLGPKGDQLTMVGYGPDIGTYRLYDSTSRKIVVSRDVEFNEEGYIRAHYLPYQDHYGMGDEKYQPLPDVPEPAKLSPQPESFISQPATSDVDTEDDVPQRSITMRPSSARGSDVQSVKSDTTEEKIRRLEEEFFYDPIADVDEQIRQMEAQMAAGNLPDFSNSSHESSEDPLVDMSMSPERKMHVAQVILDIADPSSIPEPQSLKEAMTSPWAEHWRNACMEELGALETNKTWEVIEDPGNVNVLGGKWVFTVKPMADSKKVRFKARWVVKGYDQQAGIDYNETFAPVMNGKSWHIIFALAAKLGYKIRQFDVKNAYLNGDLKEQVYMEQPHGFGKAFPNIRTPICHLLKSLYGLKQAGHVWYKLLVEILTTLLGFKQMESDNAVFVRDDGQVKVVVGGHVDDLLAMAPNEEELNKLQSDLEKHLKISPQDISFFLGVDVIRNDTTGTIFIHQKRKILELLAETNMKESRPVSTPLKPGTVLSRQDKPQTDEERKGINPTFYRKAVGSLMHIMTMTRPDITEAVKILSECLDDPSPKHIDSLLWLLRYLNGTRGFGIEYIGKDDPRARNSNLNLSLHGYHDADWAQDPHDRTSRTGYVFLMAGGAISWWSGKQAEVATSTTHAEYISQDAATREMTWLKQLLSEMGFPPQGVPEVFGSLENGPLLYGDNRGAQALARNPIHHKLSKHFDIKLHFIRQQLNRKVLELRYIPTQNNVADIMTKAVQRPVLERHRDGMGMRNIGDD